MKALKKILIVTGLVIAGGTMISSNSALRSNYENVNGVFEFNVDFHQTDDNGRTNLTGEIARDLGLPEGVGFL